MARYTGAMRTISAGLLLLCALMLSGCPGVLKVKESVALASAKDGAPVTTTVTVEGSYCESARVEVWDKQATWLSASPANVKLGDSVTITADPKGLAPGEYNTNVKLFPDKGSGMWTIHVHFSVEDSTP